MKRIVLLAASALGMLFAGAGLAQSWPAKPVHLIVPFAPGGPADIAARMVAQKMPEMLGEQMIVDNRGGAGGNIGATAVAKSASDGYTVLLTTSAFAVNVSLFSDPGYDAQKDFIPVVMVASQPNLFFVNPNVPVKTLPEFIAYAKGRRLAFASPGSGTTPHLTGENVLRVLAKLDVTAVHYRGAGPAVAAVVAGEPLIGCGAISGPLAQIKGGRLRALAVSSAKRIPSLPDVPTLAEAGFPGIEDYTWIGIFLPAGTPAAIVQKLNDAVNRAIQSADLRERLAAQAFDPAGGSQQQFADYVKSEIAKWGKVVRETGAKAD
jgi:tripartite-type tricarboxylate transporter receptor subunit TctC